MISRKWFNEKMSSNELTKALFSIPKEEYDSQKENIMKEYREIRSIVLDREIELALQGEID